MLEPNTLSKNNGNNSSAILLVMNFVSIANIRKKCGRNTFYYCSPLAKARGFQSFGKSFLLSLLRPLKYDTPFFKTYSSILIPAKTIEFLFISTAFTKYCWFIYPDNQSFFPCCSAFFTLKSPFWTTEK